ncbi:MAG: hypothetical protein ACLP6G_24105 [Terriglobales bacterium]
MKAKLMFAALLVVAAVLAFGQQNKKPQPLGTGKFSMVVAEVDEGTKAATVFVINSDTGQVWRWYPQTTLDSGGKVYEHFEPIPFSRYEKADKDPLAIHETDHPQ